MINTDIFIELGCFIKVPCSARSWHSSTSVAPKTVLGAVLLILNVISTHSVLLNFKVNSCRRLMIYCPTIWSGLPRRGWIPLGVWFLTRVDLHLYFYKAAFVKNAIQIQFSSIDISPAIDWRLVQGVPRLSPSQPPMTLTDKRNRCMMDEQKPSVHDDSCFNTNMNSNMLIKPHSFMLYP